MVEMIGTSAAHSRIGNLLLKAGIVSEKQLDDATSRAIARGEHIGQALKGCGYIDDRSLRLAVAIQSSLKDGVVSPFTARKALALAHRSNKDIEQVLGRLGVRLTSAIACTNKLGELLIESSIITHEELKLALTKARESSMPLGRVLVEMGFVNEPQKSSLLEVQSRVRDGMITREFAIGAFVEIKKQVTTSDTRLDQHRARDQMRYKRLKEALRKHRAAYLRMSYIRLADHHAERNNLSESAALMGRAVELSRDIHPRANPRLANDLLKYGALLFATKQFIPAERSIAESLELIRSCVPVDHTKLASCLHRLAVAQAACSLLADAEPNFLNSIALWKAHGYVSDIRLADTCFDYARFLIGTGRAEKAEEVYREARAILEEYALLELIDSNKS